MCFTSRFDSEPNFKRTDRFNSFTDMDVRFLRSFFIVFLTDFSLSFLEEETPGGTIPSGAMVVASSRESLILDEGLSEDAMVLPSLLSQLLPAFCFCALHVRRDCRNSHNSAVSDELKPRTELATKLRKGFSLRGRLDRDTITSRCLRRWVGAFDTDCATRLIHASCGLCFVFDTRFFPS